MPVMKVGPGRALLGGGGNYNDLVMGTQPIAYWPQSESSGLTAYCLTNPAMNGTYTGVTLANDLTGPFGTPAPFYDGANDYCNIYSAALNTAFSGAEGTVAIWAKVNGIGVWTDAAIRQTINLWVNGNNYLRPQKMNVNNLFQHFYRANAIGETVNSAGRTDIVWMHVALSWSKSAEEMKAYIYGAQVGATQINLGVWAGNLLNTACCIGANGTGPSEVWHGWLGPCAIWNRALTPAEIAALYVT